MKRVRMLAKFDGKCNHCMKTVTRGTAIFYDPDHKAVFHPGCKDQPWVQVVGRKQMWRAAGVDGRLKNRGPIYTAMRNA